MPALARARCRRMRSLIRNPSEIAWSEIAEALQRSRYSLIAWIPLALPRESAARCPRRESVGAQWPVRPRAAARRDDGARNARERVASSRTAADDRVLPHGRRRRSDRARGGT